MERCVALQPETLCRKPSDMTPLDAGGEIVILDGAIDEARLPNDWRRPGIALVRADDAGRLR